MKKTILMFLLVFSTIMNAQTDKIKISGKVVDNSGLAIPNASVSVDGNNTVTDIDGKYTVVANSAKSVIKFSFVGFDEKSATVGKNTVINISELKINSCHRHIVHAC